jgi:hypothetical protein
VLAPEVAQQSNDSGTDAILSKGFQKALVVDRVERFVQNLHWSRQQ